MYLCCLFLAVFFWLLNALGNQYDTIISFEVNYKNLPKNQVVLNELPKSIAIKIKGLGFDLMAYKLRIKRSIVAVDLSTINNYHEREGIITKTIATKVFQPYISSQLGEHIDVQETYPDSIYFILDEKVEKLMLIDPNTTITYDKQFQLFGEIVLKPSAVKVMGPKSVLDTMDRIYTEPLRLTNLNETTTESVSFDLIYDNLKLTFDPAQVFIHIPVEKYTETTKKVKLDAINVPDSITLKTIPGEVQVKFRIPLSKMAALEGTVFTAQVDFKEINSRFNHKLKVMLAKHPDFIQSITISPSKVEYILKKND